MMITSLVAIAAVFCVRGVSAHGGVLSYSNGGNWYSGFAPYNTPVGQSTIQRPWATYNPIQDPTSNLLACNDDGTQVGATQLTATVKAGSTITAYWNQVWPHNTGPMLTYLAQCPGTTCTSVNANSLKWFKIQEAGLLSGSVGGGKWAAGQMIAQNSSWTTTIPTTVPNGNYLIRFETIALHSMPAQFYPECAQITITGGGSLAPTAAQLVSFPGAYLSTDPGVTIDLYSQTANSTLTYVIPGPALYGSSTAPPATIPGSSAPASTPASTPAQPAPTTVTAPHTTSTPVPASPQYGQCGGQGWTGATTCVAPFTCKATNQYYSQCL